MAKMTTPTPELTDPVWAATPKAHWHIVPGGSRLDIVTTPLPFPPPDPGKRLVIKSGTLIARTLAERDADPPVGFKPWQAGQEPPDFEVYLTVFDNVDVLDNPDIELLVPSKSMQIYENMLPNWAGRPDEEKAMIRRLYHCIVATEVTI